MVSSSIDHHDNGNLAAASAVADGIPIKRANRQDKEFHFQNWFKSLLEAQGLDFDEPGRNIYSDFRLVHNAVGYEIKGLGFPGRLADYDCNSQIPHGVYRGRQIIYVFGRYPAKPESNKYPVFDLVLCHGSFLNADDEYVHKVFAGWKSPRFRPKKPAFSTYRSPRGKKQAASRRN